MIFFNPFKKSPLLAKIKFEPTFFQVLWRLPFRFRFKARRAEGGFGGNSARRASRWQNQFGFFQIHTASWKKKGLARPLRGLASRF
jgi:hypothetical protein